jgi:hypothetical protein
MAKATIGYVPPPKQKVKIMSTVCDANSSRCLRQAGSLRGTEVMISVALGLLRIDLHYSAKRAFFR